MWCDWRRFCCEEALFLAALRLLLYIAGMSWGLKIMQTNLAHEKIEAIWDSAVEEILAVNGRVQAIRTKNLRTGTFNTISCKGVFIAIGHLPNTQPFEGVLDLDDNGYLIPESGSMVKTKISGVFVAGDCADHVYRQAITAAGMGCQSAIEAERWLAESN